MGIAADELLEDDSKRKRSTRELLRDKINAEMPKLTEEEKKRKRHEIEMPVTGHRG